MAGQGEQEAQKELQKAVERVVDDFSNKSLTVQRKGVQCSLNCFDDSATNKDYKQVGECIQRCQKPFEELTQVTMKEFNGLQQSIQGCAQSCHSKARPQIEAMRAGLAGAGETEQKALYAEIEQCTVKCINDGFTTLKGVEDRLMGYLRRQG